MKTTDIGFENFPAEFCAQNTFIVGHNATLLNEASTQLAKLNAEGNTVLVTDPYLFYLDPLDSTYQSELITLLSGLKASKIIYCAHQKSSAAFFQQVHTALQAKGTVLDFDNRLVSCHDRFWYCPETEKCVVFGTSLNGIGKKICRIDMLTEDETKELKQYFISAGILASGDDSGA